MLRQDVLGQIQKICEDKYNQNLDFTHGNSHVREVVKNCEEIAIKENLKEKDIFLVKIAAWLHDLGRTEEQDGKKRNFNHAESSYRQARNILKKYQAKIGREGVYKILQAIREHNLAILDHKENIIARILQDGDRGSNLSIKGVGRILVYKEVIKLSEKEIEGDKKDLMEKIINKVNKNNGGKAIIWLEYLKGFYLGEKINNRLVLEALHTVSAKKMYKKGLDDIEEILTRIKEELDIE